MHLVEPTTHSRMRNLLDVQSFESLSCSWNWTELAQGGSIGVQLPIYWPVLHIAGLHLVPFNPLGGRRPAGYKIFPPLAQGNAIEGVRRQLRP